MKVKLSITVGEQTDKLLRKYSEDLDMTMSGFITLLINNYHKEQSAINMMNNAELMQKLMEGVRIEAERNN